MGPHAGGVAYSLQQTVLHQKLKGESNSDQEDVASKMRNPALIVQLVSHLCNVESSASSSDSFQWHLITGR